ncbi:universal stress protein [Parafrankia elaeagni]|uniref:universal stress protein n=1 Tax=Parafrankia elaeagni TaxID=222534 RepID=UPI00036076D9|nr:universal stress protein [Parafrankia elaeagni]
MTDEGRNGSAGRSAGADIVVGIDGSPGSESALRWAVTEASRRGARVRAVLGSCPHEQPSAVRRWADATAGPHDEGTLAQAAGQVLHEALTDVELPPGLAVVEEVIDAPGSEALLTAGRDAEMIVVGTRGRGLLHRLRIGSVSASVAVHSPVPVVVARAPRTGDDEDAAESAGPAGPAGRSEQQPHTPESPEAQPPPVVVGVDGSPNSLAALRWAADEAVLRGAPLHVVHAWLAAMPLPFAETSGEIVAALEDQARAVLDDSIAQVIGAAAGPGQDGPAAPTPSVRRVLVAASATRALLEESRDADLLVVGARGRGGFAELLLGSVSHQTMLHATAPVAIIHGH